ncbi:hypothetical protein GYB14_00060 [bacterium]|uniref:hypothetical protein n=1 Tax=Salipiger bermudensis TaxID=344736 RepID=UPI001CD4B68E|nr:hypothetical protein [Salipiger bermudensis]MBR9890057.1 hypothetical protein [bacterium]MCA1286011.1 hypothetical protein [Salipiger bermudensis]
MSRAQSDLGQLTRLLQDRAFEQHRRDRDEERRLLDELARIDALRQAAFDETESLADRRLIGADTLWQGWLSRRRGELNRDLARCRVQQEHSLARARLALARAEATKRVHEQEAAILRHKRLHQEEIRLDALWRLAFKDPEV